MIAAIRTYTEQDIIELFNGDQTHIFKVIAEAINDRVDVAETIKNEIMLMERSIEDAELIKQLERDRLHEEVEAYDRDPFGLKRAFGWWN